MLTAFSVSCLAVAFLLYLQGVPGAPSLPEWPDVTSSDKSKYRSGDAIRLLAPSGLSIQQRITLGNTDPVYLADSEGPLESFNPPDEMLSLDPHTVTLTVDIQWQKAAPFALVLGLQSGARVPRRNGLRLADLGGAESAQIAGPYSEWEEKLGPSEDRPPFDTDFYVIHLTPDSKSANGSTPKGMAFTLALKPYWPLITRDNSRAVLRSPRFDGTYQCEDMPEVVRNLEQPGRPAMGGGPQGSEPTWDDIPFFCSKRPKQELLVSLDLDRTDWRADVLYPVPSEGIRNGLPDGATWWASSQPLRVAGNYTNINAEARGQRLLFLSGLLAGLGLSLVPMLIGVKGRRNPTPPSPKVSSRRRIMPRRGLRSKPSPGTHLRPRRLRNLPPKR